MNKVADRPIGFACRGRKKQASRNTLSQVFDASIGIPLSEYIIITMESSYNQMDCRGNAYATCRGQCVCELLGAMRMRTAGGDAYAICRGQRVCALQGAMRMRFVGGYANASCRGQCVCELPGAMRMRTAGGNAYANCLGQCVCELPGAMLGMRAGPDVITWRTTTPFGGSEDMPTRTLSGRGGGSR